MADGKKYEVLRSLAAQGRISVEDSAKLEQHLNECASCRGAYTEFDEFLQKALSAEQWTEKSTGLLAGLFFKRKHYMSRFSAKARERGIHFSEEVMGADAPIRRPFLSWLAQYYKLAVIVILLLGTVLLFAQRLRQSQNQYQTIARQNIQLRTEIEELRQQVAALSQAKSSLEAKLLGSHETRSLAQSRARELEERSVQLSSEITVLKANLSLSGQREAQLESQLREAERVVEEANTELQGLRMVKQVNAQTIEVQQARIEELSQRLDVHMEKLDRASRLLAADRDIRELMAARKLHIIDVFDVDDKGKTKRPFGRVFYTEERSLVFYAFDLADDRITPAKYSFQAWGYREPAVRSAQSLGLFYVDDEKQKRWVLRFDDPEILAEIDAIFVTAEPSGGQEKPTGRKLLYAYLRNKPNHP